MSIRKISLDPNNGRDTTNELLSVKSNKCLMYYCFLIAGSLPPVYQRSLLVLSTAMMMFAAKLYHVADTNNLLNLLFETDVSMKSLCFRFMGIMFNFWG